ncbi:RHS repeat-associated core domain-containing protein [Pseudomonas reidholzensis]|nr:RHS repeat-associated core domain-containing protein [Pseudomonas reidholzensis]
MNVTSGRFPGLGQSEQRGSPRALLFYQNGTLAALVRPGDCQRLMRAQGRVLAQRSGCAAQASALLVQTDPAGSTLVARNQASRHAMAYGPYGHLAEDAAVTSLGFNGQWREPTLEGYLLGNGYRLYQPGLMRFYSPDRHSPFGDGGVNGYCYCSGDPVNHVDPTGRVRHTLFQRVAGMRPMQPEKSTVVVSPQGIKLDLLPADIVTVAKSATVSTGENGPSISFSFSAIEGLEQSKVTLDHRGFSMSVPVGDVGKVLINSSPLGPPETVGGIQAVVPLNIAAHVRSEVATPTVTLPLSQVASIGKGVAKAVLLQKASNIRSALRQI